MKTAVYTLTSELHNEQAVSAVTQEFLNSLELKMDFRGADYSDYGTHTLDLIYVRTGGTEGFFRKLLPTLLKQSTKPFYLLTSGKSNSLAASMEILSFLRQNGLRGEIIHGSPWYITQRIQLLTRTAYAREQLKGCRLGVIGKPSDWLIASQVDKEIVQQKLGIELVSIPMQELLDVVKETPLHDVEDLQVPMTPEVKKNLPGAMQIYAALTKLVKKHKLKGFTLRCFDLLTAVHNTGCVALASMNSEGITAGCEGDVPALLSMKIAQVLTGVSGFQANPARIDVDKGVILLAHCTIPLNMVKRYELDTHFESGIGVGIRGYLEEGPVTLFKVSGDLSRHFIAEGELIRNLAEPDLCRSQVVVRLNDPSQANYFLTDPIGNHHIVIPGYRKEILENLLGD